MSDRLKERIKTKFGSMSKFARLARQNRYELQKVFSRKTMTPAEVRRLEKLINRTRVKKADGEITEAQLKLFIEAIEAAGGAHKFTKDNPQFPRASVFEVLGGKRKLISNGVRKLFDHFKIE